MWKQFLLAIAIGAALGSCGGEATNDRLDEDLQAFKKSTDVSERYELYLDVYNSENPPNLALAGELAASGRGAYDEAVRHALKSADPRPFLAAMEIIARYNRLHAQVCSPSGLTDLNRKAASLSSRGSQSLSEIAARSCRR